jgi:SAM-dependent methyltransferase
MPFTSRQIRRFQIARDSLIATGRGLEPTMYGHLRDLFIEVLGYSAGEVDIDRRGERGRPDLTVFAQGGAADTRVAWIVLEAKDEHGACRTPRARARLFAEKSKYITADTAWFVMVDPTAIVARASDKGTNAEADIVVPLTLGLGIDEFAEMLAPLRAEAAGVPNLLRRFREGDESLIATERLFGDDVDALAVEIARNGFYDGLAETTRLLQSATLSALVATRAERLALQSDIDAFGAEFNGAVFNPYPISVHGSPVGREQTLAHGRAAHHLNRRLSERPALARLALEALPRFAQRTGIKPIEEIDRLERFFATETANLILARILLLRFLEDHGFFDLETPDGVVRRRYLCNGGVLAFQGMREYFGQGYTRLLEDAYRSGANIYAAAFNETEHDWVLALSDENLSRTVEWAMYRFARFDFTTIRGDLLTGVYDRFLDARQRKAQGEFYTPPTIARYILERLELGEQDEVLDPACGSGTFLIERYQQAVGEDADHGLATYEEAVAAVERIAGNDLNPFSAVLTQIQLLWHLLAFGPQVRRQGLPALRVAERANSLVPTILKDQTATRFGDIDQTGYAAVAGNPPYVRPERGIDIDPAARDYYTAQITRNGTTFEGLAVDRNIYRLFIYRALDHWCRQPAWDEDGSLITAAGRMGFVIPLNFCASNEAADLRRLFAPGGRWTIREIVDMELIWRDVFDADVLPMILFAEARAPTEDDQVTIRLVDDTSVVRSGRSRRARATFDLSRAPEATIPYADLFTPEGRIATRLTPDRLAIVRKLRSAAKLSSAAKSYWVRARGGRAVTDVRPSGIGEAQWSERQLITDGAARRGRGTEGSPGGLDVYKGENVRTGGLVGEPTFRSIDVWNLSTPSVWGYREILPRRMWAFPIITQVPCAAPFDPNACALLNTVTVFGPREDLVDFPFDLAITSRIYGWYTLLSLRSSYQNMLRGHLYPTTIGQLPWTEELGQAAAQLEALRDPFFTACRRRFEAESEMRAQAQQLGLAPLREVFREKAARGSSLEFSEHFDDGEAFTVTLPIREQDVANADELDEELTLVISADGHMLTFPTAELRRLAESGLTLVEGSDLTKTGLLRLPTPPDAETAERVDAMIAEFAADALDAAVFAEVDKIDEIVGVALGLDHTDIAFVQAEMEDDPFLSRVQPRYPYFTPAQRGRRHNLERAVRYGQG